MTSGDDAGEFSTPLLHAATDGSHDLDSVGVGDADLMLTGEKHRDANVVSGVLQTTRFGSNLCSLTLAAQSSATIPLAQ